MSKHLWGFLVCGAVFCGMSGGTLAQTDPWIANEISKQNQRNLENDNRIRARRAWEIRERKVQAEIAKHRATPYYQAIAYDFDVKGAAMGGGGYYSEKKAIEDTLKQCRSSNCQIVASFANSCAMVAFPAGGAKTLSEIFVGLDKDGYQAIVKSIRACETKYGYGNCRYSDFKTKSGDAVCTGYDYSIYGQH